MVYRTAVLKPLWTSYDNLWGFNNWRKFWWAWHKHSRKNKVRALSALMGIYFWFGESGKKMIRPKLRCTKTRLKHQQDVSAVIRSWWCSSLRNWDRNQSRGTWTEFWLHLSRFRCQSSCLAHLYGNEFKVKAGKKITQVWYKPCPQLKRKSHVIHLYLYSVVLYKDYSMTIT